jgi:hypothetical protein
LDKRVSSEYKKIAKDADANDLEVTLRATLRKVHSVLNCTKSTLGSLSTQRSFIIRTSPYSDLVGQRLEFRLDDAIHVLKSLDQGATTIDFSHTSEQIEAMVESRFQRAMLTARTSSIEEQPAEQDLRNLIDSKIQNTLLGSTHTRSEIKVPENRKLTWAPQNSKRMKGQNGSNVCYDCGTEGHFCVDPSCPKPSWVSLQRRKKVEEESNGSVPFFQQGHRKYAFLQWPIPLKIIQTWLPPDINPILDNGCPKSAGGLENIVTLSLAQRIRQHPPVVQYIIENFYSRNSTIKTI